MSGKKINCGIMALVLCAAAAFLLTGLAERACADHICDGDTCPLCSLGRLATNVSRPLKNAPPRSAFPPGIAPASLGMTKQFFYYTPASSVRLKIKMNT
jgi:hypothetical protein